MKKIHIALLLMILFWTTAQSISAMKPTGELRIDLTDDRKVLETDFANNLVLRITKDSSVEHKDFGWILQVDYKSSKRNSKNLIYSNPTGTTADRSQFYAWQIGNKEFPDYRVLTVKGQPLRIKVELINPVVEGADENARFVSGTMKISWSR